MDPPRPGGLRRGVSSVGPLQRKATTLGGGDSESGTSSRRISTAKFGPPVTMAAPIDDTDDDDFDDDDDDDHPDPDDADDLATTWTGDGDGDDEEQGPDTNPDLLWLITRCTQTTDGDWAAAMDGYPLSGPEKYENAYSVPMATYCAKLTELDISGGDSSSDDDTPALRGPMIRRGENTFSMGRTRDHDRLTAIAQRPRAEKITQTEERVLYQPRSLASEPLLPPLPRQRAGSKPVKPLPTAPGGSISRGGSTVAVPQGFEPPSPPPATPQDAPKLQKGDKPSSAQDRGGRGQSRQKSVRPSQDGDGEDTYIEGLGIVRLQPAQIRDRFKSRVEPSRSPNTDTFAAPDEETLPEDQRAGTQPRSTSPAFDGIRVEETATYERTQTPVESERRQSERRTSNPPPVNPYDIEERPGGRQNPLAGMVTYDRNARVRITTVQQKAASPVPSEAPSTPPDAASPLLAAKPPHPPPHAPSPKTSTFGASATRAQRAAIKDREQREERQARQQREREFAQLFPDWANAEERSRPPPRSDMRTRNRGK